MLRGSQEGFVLGKAGDAANLEALGNLHNHRALVPAKKIACVGFLRYAGSFLSTIVAFM